MTRRHCMVVHAYYPYAEARVERQVDCLLEQGIDVDVICLRYKNGPAEERQPHLNIFRLPVRRHKKSGALIQLSEYLLFAFLVFFRLVWTGNRYDTIQIHTPPEFLVFAALWPKIRGKKIILDIHDPMPEFFQARFEKPENNSLVRLIRFQEKLSCRFADHVITVSEAWRDMLDDRCGIHGRSSVIMNLPGSRFIDHIPEFQPDIPQQGYLKLVYHGNITYRYGLDVVLKAMRRVVPKFPNLTLIVRGAGDYLPQFEGLVQSFGLEGNVDLVTKAIPTEQLPGFLRQANVGVVPYRNDVFTDGIVPTKFLEYMYLGLPTIVTNTTAMENLVDNDSAWFFQPGDEDKLVTILTDILQHPQQIGEYRDRLSRYQEIYRWEEYARRYVEIITKHTPERKLIE